MGTTLRARVDSATGAIDRSIAILALLSFISQVGVSIMLPLLPLYAVQVGATPAQLGLMVGAFSVTNTIGQLSSGVLSGWISARRQMPLGQAVYATGNFLIATASAAVPLIAFRALSGLGGGLTIIAERLYIARVTAQARLAFVNGIVSAAGSSGSVVGPLLGAVLATQDLRVPFIVVGCTATVAGLAALAFLPPERRPDSEARAGAPADAEALPESSELIPEAIPTGATDAAAAAERHTSRWAHAAPLIRLGLWSVGFNAAYGGWITTFSNFMTQELGHAAQDVALFFAPFGAGAILLGPALARVADRTGRRRMIAIGSGMVLVNLVALILGTPLVVIYGTAVIAGGGLAAAQSSWFALLGVATDGGRRGRSFSTVAALSNLGVIAGAVAASAAWTLVGLQAGVITSAAFLVLAGASLLLIPSDRRRA